MPTSFLTARAANRKWQISKSGAVAAGKPCRLEADRPTEESSMLVVMTLTDVNQCRIK